MSLSSETRSSLSLTLSAMIRMTKSLLDTTHHYVCLGQFQADRLEAEFGIYRQMSGGNYFVSVEQVLCSLQLRRLKLFDQLETTPETSLRQSECCTSDLSDFELEIVDDSVISNESLTPEIMASLYYVCGYISRKEACFMAHHSPDFQARDCSSEFLENVSRGKLSFPSESFFSYAKACLHVFNAITSKSSSTARCANRLHRLFMVLGNVYPCDFQGKLYPASRRLVNVFFKVLLGVKSNGQLLSITMVLQTENVKNSPTVRVVLLRFKSKVFSISFLQPISMNFSYFNQMKIDNVI